jgi:glutamine synthetase
MCSFFDHQGVPLELAPENILKKAVAKFRETTGMNLKFLGELEYYVNSKASGFFQAEDQKGYHESEPFSKFEEMRKEALKLIAACGGRIKYGHSEVGNFLKGDESFEQQEIEFLPTDPGFAAEQLVIAKWVLRMLAKKMGVEISFAPKITEGKAGSGLHFHMLIEKDGRNVVLENGKISDLSKRVIAGILDAADALTAFGNTIPTSYLRLVPHQEAPTNICWGARNRSALVRVPLGWTGNTNMAELANPGIAAAMNNPGNRQTFEFRVPDGSADVHLTIAGLIVAALHGFNMPDALEMADRHYIEGKKTEEILTGVFNRLPASCNESASRLEQKRKIFEADGIFPPRLIDYTLNRLRSFKDENLRNEISGNEKAVRELVLKYIHCQ